MIRSNEVSPTLETSPKDSHSLRKSLAGLLALTFLAFLVIGYHPGIEDDSFYLAAIKRDLNPNLFPHDADFFRVQFQATVFDKLVAASVKLTHLPLAWVALLWQLAAMFFILHGCLRIARRCFALPEAQWAATALVGVLLSLPLPGIAINLADQHLHPRNLATAAILAAIAYVIDRRPWIAAALLAVAFSIHAIMAAFGISFCLFLWWTLRPRSFQPLPVVAAFLIPLGWLFEPASSAWRQAAATREFYFLTRWHWYEWLGVFAPLALVYALCYVLRRRNDVDEYATLLSLSFALLYFGVFQTIAGIAIMLPPSLERLRPLEPMRYLHLLYLLFLLISGGLLGGYVLRRKLYRWLLLFVPLGAGLLYAQSRMYPASAHFEMPWSAPDNDWLEAFAWIRGNTPADALFALDPHYESVAGEDHHGFRALAERSALADYDKDGGMAARVPSLAPRWLKEVTALNGWAKFELGDLDRIKKEFGVNWVVLSHGDALYSQPGSLACPYENDAVKVCRLY